MSKKALVIIDVQKAMFQEDEPVHNGEVLIQNLCKLINLARSCKIPIFYIQHNEKVGQPLEKGTVGWEIHEDIGPHDEDVIIQKWTPDSFLNTTFDEELKSKGIQHLYLTGIQTEVCVDTTCRRAYSMGYKVTLVSDTHSTWDSSVIAANQIINHHNHTLRWFAEVAPCNSIEFNEEK